MASVTRPSLPPDHGRHAVPRDHPDGGWTRRRQRPTVLLMGHVLSSGAGVAAAGLLLCACGGTAPQRAFPLGMPGRGIAASDAITATRRFFPVGQDPVISVRAGHERDLAPAYEESSSDRFVWAVIFHGSYPFRSCGPPPLPNHPTPTCPPPAGTLVVYVDYATGRVLSAEFPAPPQLLPPSTGSPSSRSASALVPSSRRPPGAAGTSSPARTRPRR